jgi:hypothetical protein
VESDSEEDNNANDDADTASAVSSRPAKRPRRNNMKASSSTAPTGDSASFVSEGLELLGQMSVALDTMVASQRSMQEALLSFTQVLKAHGASA